MDKPKLKQDENGIWYVKGDIGYVVGDVEGNVWGDVGGSVGGNVEGNVMGDVDGNVMGSVDGNVMGSVYGDVGDVRGAINGREWRFTGEDV